MGNKRLQFHHVDEAGTADQIVGVSINLYEQSQSTVFHSLSRNILKDGEIINQHTHIRKLVRVRLNEIYTPTLRVMLSFITCWTIPRIEIICGRTVGTGVNLPFRA